MIEGSKGRSRDPEVGKGGVRLNTLKGLHKIIREVDSVEDTWRRKTLRVRKAITGQIEFSEVSKSLKAVTKRGETIVLDIELLEGGELSKTLDLFNFVFTKPERSEGRESIKTFDDLGEKKKKRIVRERGGERNDVSEDLL